MDIKEQLDVDRWLAKNGLISNSFKNNIIVYGYLSCMGVKDVECNIDVENCCVSYILFLDKKYYKKYDYYIQNMNSTFFITKWKLRRIAKKYGDFNFKSILNKLVQSYAGVSWYVNKVEIRYFNKEKE